MRERLRWHHQVPSVLSRFLPIWATVAQRLKCLPAMRETGVWSLGREDPLEKEMATHSSILAWRIPWTEELGGLQSTGLQRVGPDWATSLHYLEGNPARDSSLMLFLSSCPSPQCLKFLAQWNVVLTQKGWRPLLIIQMTSVKRQRKRVTNTLLAAGYFMKTIAVL